MCAGLRLQRFTVRPMLRPVRRGEPVSRRVRVRGWGVRDGGCVLLVPRAKRLCVDGPARSPILHKRYRICRGATKPNGVRQCAACRENSGGRRRISVYSEIISLGSCPAPELGLEGTGTAKRRTAAYLNFACCGVIDVDAPFFNHFPLCIQGPERACEDGVTAENCAARCNSTHHPGQTCAEEPCEGEAP